MASVTRPYHLWCRTGTFDGDTSSDGDVSSTINETAELDSDDCGAINLFILKKRSLLRKFTKDQDYTCAKKRVYSLDPVLVVQFIGQNHSLPDGIDPKSRKWSHLRKLFVRAISEENHPLYDMGFLVGNRNLFSNIITGKQEISYGYTYSDKDT